MQRSLNRVWCQNIGGKRTSAVTRHLNMPACTHSRGAQENEDGSGRENTEEKQPEAAITLWSGEVDIDSHMKLHITRQYFYIVLYHACPCYTVSLTKPLAGTVLCICIIPFHCYIYVRYPDTIIGYHILVHED